MKLEQLNHKQQEVLYKTIHNVVVMLQITGAEKGQVEKKLVMELAIFSFNNNSDGYLTTSERLECIPILIDTVYQSEKKKKSKRIK